MNLQHVNVKIFVHDPATIDPAAFIPVFHEWIQDQVHDELLIDVADYRHVPGGPGVVLVGHEANYSMDHADHRWGLLYNRKTPVSGSAQHRISQAIQAALRACYHLERHPALYPELSFDGREMHITLNDRLAATNTEESYRAFAEPLRPVLDALYGGKNYTLDRLAGNDPRKRLTVRVTASASFTVDRLLAAYGDMVTVS